MFQKLADMLGFQLKWVGKWVIAKNKHEERRLKRLQNVGIINNVSGLEIIDGLEVEKKEPNVSCYKALWVPTAGIVLPYEFTIALAENAAENNIKFIFIIQTNKGNFQAQIVVNAAGLNCREIVDMIEVPDFQVYPCRGEYLVLDKIYSYLVNSMIYPIPGKEFGVLGVHITPTVEGNILVGPSAEFIIDADDKSTTQNMMNTLIKEAKEIIPALPDKAVINAYSGVRCKLASEKSGGWTDYRIEESKLTVGLINLLGIESPGLTAAPAIAQEIRKMISKHIKLEIKKEFKSKRAHRKRFSEISIKEKANLIKKDKRWGRIVCRCEQITEAEVINALSNPLGARSLSVVKNRCRAGMGRCQGGFCTQHIVRIMEEHFNICIDDMKLKTPNSYLFDRRTREAQDDR
jgi:glycerol-3-phosphate dehydrogenase